LMKRGKKGVSQVRNGTCTGCYMKLASGQYAMLLRAEDVMICDSCGRYLHVSDEEIKAATEPEKKQVKKRAAAKKKTTTKKKAAKKTAKKTAKKAAKKTAKKAAKKTARKTTKKAAAGSSDNDD